VVDVTAAAAVTPTTVTITSVIAFLSVLAGLAGAVIGLASQARGKRTAAKVEEIRVNIDGRLTQQLEKVNELFDRQAELTAALHAAGEAAPGVAVEPVLIRGPLAANEVLLPGPLAAAENLLLRPVVASDPIDGGST
jgi:hypothetical protein